MRLLSRLGHGVDVARDARSALGLWDHNAYDVLLADIGLPDGTGWELMKSLRSQGPVRAIAISGYGYSDDIQKSLQAGFIEHLTKPVSFDDLRTAIERIAALPQDNGGDGDGTRP